MTVEVKKSRSGDIVPVLNGVHLHSIYDPEKEACEFLDKHTEDIDQNDYFMVWGLGFGFHIYQLQQYLREKNKDINILVIEPSSELVREYFGSSELKHKIAAKIISKSDPIALYNDEFIIDFLSKTPLILSHAPSVQMHKEYFEKFQNYQAPVDIHTVQKNIKSRWIATEMGQLNPESNIENYLKTKIENTNDELSKFDYFIGAIESIVESTK